MKNHSNSPQADVLGVVSANPSFETFRSAIARANLSCAFRTLDEVTVFAPTDAAFDRLSPGQRRELFDGADTRLLATILWYHVAAGVRSSGQVGDYVSANTANGQSLLISLVRGETRVDGALVVIPDLSASNGVVHGIDKVNLPRRLSADAEPQHFGVPPSLHGSSSGWRSAPWVPRRLKPLPHYGKRN